MNDKIPGTKISLSHQSKLQASIGQGGFGEIKLFGGSSVPELTEEIAQYLGLPVGVYERTTFSNENIFIQLKESVRGQDVYVVQSMSAPVHDNFMELMIMVDALKRDSAWRVNVVVPYMSYGRSDKKDQPRVSISARLVANLIEASGVDRYITVDLHAGQIQGFFNIPGDVLTAFYLLSDYVAEKNIPDLTVVSTDLGYAKQARNWGQRLDVPVALVEKRRVDNAENPQVLSIIGDVEGRNVLLVDDEVNTAGSVQNAAKVLRDNGAKDIYLAFTHGFFTDKTIERFSQVGFKEIITTNTIQQPEVYQLPNLKVLSVGPLLGEVIRRAHLGLSVGQLFNE
ncbi:MAG: ribose-phosphate pyrophosphokinase [Anaerolineaceae bacterium]|nr:MAG: ribose-phosphate pyrophosphokinase [Anaerolineaceae bacterium]